MRRPVFFLIAWLALVLLPGGWAYGLLSSAPVQHLTSAQMQVNGIQEFVRLPHEFKSEEFEGNRAIYTLQVDLDHVPAEPLAIYIPKLSLAGQVFVNGQYLWACGHGSLEKLRCMHRPQLISIPAISWRVGYNEIRVEIFADTTEINGLSSIWVGDASVLRQDFFQWRQLIAVDLLIAVTWISGFLAALGFGASLVLRQKPIYFWFATATLSNVFANIFSLMDFTIFDPRVFAWLVGASRFLSVTLGFLTYLAWFEKLRPGIRNGILAYTALAIILIGLANTNRSLLALLYLPFFIVAPILIWYMFNWSSKSKNVSHWIALCSFLIVFAVGIHDLSKLMGFYAFENIFLLTFAGSAVSVALGITAIGVLASGLRESEMLRSTLEVRVVERTQELAQTHATLLKSEVERAQIQGRELLLRDVHDGFGSQLLTASMLVKASKLTQEEMETLLQECIDDLYLVIDISSATAEQFFDMMLDFKTRFSRRVIGGQARLHWDFQKGHWPQISKTTALHMLRILQEGVTNALKHSRSTNIWITASFDHSTQILRLKVVDDGTGMTMQSALGRGIHNMSKRAGILGGELTITDARPGTSVELQVGITQAHF